MFHDVIHDSLIVDRPTGSVQDRTPARLVAMAVDRHVGRRIRGKRRAMGLSVADLAKVLDVAGDEITA